MVIGIIIAIILFGTLLYFGNKKGKSKVEEIIVNEDYVSVPSNLTLFESELYVRINEHRESISANTINHTDDDARKECEKHDKYMIEKGKASHANFPSRVRKLKENGAERVGEVVSYGYSSAKGTINGFLSSPSHKKILEEEGWTHIGIRAMKNPEQRYYVTILFYR